MVCQLIVTDDRSAERPCPAHALHHFRRRNYETNFRRRLGQSMTNDMARTIEDPSSPARERRISLRARLRGGSGDRHERLDRCFEGMHDADDTGLYRRFIRVNAACHAGIEPHSRRQPSQGCDRGLAIAQPRDVARRGSAGDAPFRLRALALSDREGRASPRPSASPTCWRARASARATFTVSSRRASGRTFAGKRRRRDISPAPPTRRDYFRSFMDEASRHLTTDRDEAEAVAAANATFDYFIETERAEKAAALDL